MTRAFAGSASRDPVSVRSDAVLPHTGGLLRHDAASPSAQPAPEGAAVDRPALAACGQMQRDHSPAPSAPEAGSLSSGPSAARSGRPASRRSGRRAGRGALALIAGLFALSGLIRVGDGAGRAFAAGTGVADVAAVPASPAAAPPPTGGSPEPRSAELLAALRARETALDLREVAIADRMQALALSEAAISTRLADLTEAETALRATLALADSAAEEDLLRLTAVYESMKPKQAAALFEAMDPQFSAGFLARMRPEAAGAVLSGLKPETAYAVSAVLAGRNSEVPRE